jgi:hypothetical protein
MNKQEILEKLKVKLNNMSDEEFERFCIINNLTNNCNNCKWKYSNYLDCWCEFRLLPTDRMICEEYTEVI